MTETNLVIVLAVLLISYLSVSYLLTLKHKTLEALKFEIKAVKIDLESQMESNKSAIDELEYGMDLISRENMVLIVVVSCLKDEVERLETELSEAIDAIEQSGVDYHEVLESLLEDK